MVKQEWIQPLDMRGVRGATGLYRKHFSLGPAGQTHSQYPLSLTDLRPMRAAHIKACARKTAARGVWGHVSSREVLLLIVFLVQFWARLDKLLQKPETI